MEESGLSPDQSQNPTDPETGLSTPVSAPKPTDPSRKKPYPKKKSKIPSELRIRAYDNGVARHFARIYVNKAGADAVVTLMWMKPGFEEDQYEEYARELLRHEKIQTFIDEEYKAIGIDEQGKQRYIAELWRSYYEGNDKTKQVVLGLLGRALGIGEMADESRVPTELPIKNLDKGWEQMTGAQAQDAQNPTGFGSLDEDMPMPED